MRHASSVIEMYTTGDFMLMANGGIPLHGYFDWHAKAAPRVDVTTE
jgi:hypothetical protein